MPRQNAYSLYLVLTTVAAFMFSTAFTTSGVYRFQMAELTPLQLILVGTALELSVFLFEIPTGVVADLRSRRLSVIVGYVLIGCGLFLEGAFPLFATILAAQMLWGVGYTFTSGALDAWLADELGEERLAATYLRGAQLSRIAGFAGIFVGTALAALRLNIPFLVGGVGMVLLAVYLMLRMPETNFTPTPRGDRTTWQSMGHTFAQGLHFIRRSPLLITILLIALIYGFSSEGLDRLWEAHLLDNFTIPGIADLPPIYWFAIINALTTLLTLGVTEILRRRAGVLDHRRAVLTIMAFNGVMVAGLLVFGLARHFAVAVVAYVVLSPARGSFDPIFSAWVNRGIAPKVRATVLSTVGQMDAFGQVAGGPPVGVLANRYGLRAAMVAVAVLLTPALALLGRALGQPPATNGAVIAAAETADES